MCEERASCFTGYNNIAYYTLFQLEEIKSGKKAGEFLSGELEYFIDLPKTLLLEARYVASYLTHLPVLEKYYFKSQKTIGELITLRNLTSRCLGITPADNEYWRSDFMDKTQQIIIVLEKASKGKFDEMFSTIDLAITFLKNVLIMT